MRIAFRSLTSTRGAVLIINSDIKSYCMKDHDVLYRGYDTFYMPTNKDLQSLEKKLIKEGYQEVSCVGELEAKANA